MMIPLPRFYEQFSAEQEEHQDVKIITSIQGGFVRNDDDKDIIDVEMGCNDNDIDCI